MHRRPAGLDVPEPDRAVVAAGGERAAVATDRRAVQRAGMAGDGGRHRLPGPGRPHLRRPLLLPTAASRPSGLKCTRFVLSPGCRGSHGGGPDVPYLERVGHAVPAKSTSASRRPSGLSWAPYTRGKRSGAPTARPSGSDHRRTTPSTSAVTSRRPSALRPGVRTKCGGRSSGHAARPVRAAPTVRFRR